MSKRISYVLFVLFLTPNSAIFAQDACDDYWFVRNLIFDRAGYCFGSPLGQSVFDNTDCHTKSPQLSEDDKSRIAQIKTKETEWGCSVDTARRNLDLPSFKLRLRMSDQPLHDDTESACLGYRGPDVPLRAGRSPDSPIIGYLRDGDTHIDAYTYFDGEPADTWRYVGAVFRDETRLPDIGWTNVKGLWDNCDAYAG